MFRYSLEFRDFDETKPKAFANDKVQTKATCIPISMSGKAPVFSTSGQLTDVSGKALAAGSSSAVKCIRDQFKTNATRVLREHPQPITNENF